MQRGTIFRRGHAWMLSYNVREMRAGVPIWRKRTKRLAPICDEFRTEASVRHLAAEHLAPQNAKTARPESTDSVSQFIEFQFLPHCKANVRPSTYNGYKYLFNWLKPHLGNKRLRDFDPVDGERALTNFAAEKRRAQTQLKNAKNFLSGAFRFAVRSGAIKFNPIRETMLPKNGKPLAETHAYSLEEIHSILEALGEPERTVVLVAALAGLRSAELRGLQWEDFDGNRLAVRRSVWRKHVGETKTRSSAASVPILPVVAKALIAHREGSTSKFIFAGGTGQPLVLANTTRRKITPVLAAKNIQWHGWHGFRRGLASNLYALGVSDKVIQEILRHANVAVTQQHYIKTTSPQSAAAMRRLERAFRRTKPDTKVDTKTCPHQPIPPHEVGTDTTVNG